MSLASPTPIAGSNAPIHGVTADLDPKKSHRRRNRNRNGSETRIRLKEDVPEISADSHPQPRITAMAKT